MFLIYAGVFVIGIGFVAWVLWKEFMGDYKKKNPSLVDRLGLETPGQNAESTLPEPPKPAPPEPPAHSLSEKELQEALEENSARQTEILELQERYGRLERLFQEKSDEFERIQTALNAELKAKKEFNKLKDILEKELKEVKDKNHKQQLELGALTAEIENYNKRMTQLEDKIKSKDQDIKQKEGQITDLIKRIQTFATPSTAEISQQPKAPQQPQNQQPSQVQAPKDAEQTPSESPNAVPAEEKTEPLTIETKEKDKESSEKDSKTTQGQTIIRQPPKQEPS